MKYRVKVESINPEFPIDDDRFTNGIECDGFAIVAINEGDSPDSVAIHDMNIIMLAEAMSHSSQLRQAAAISEGLSKAREIREKEVNDKLSSLGSLLGMIGGLRDE